MSRHPFADRWNHNSHHYPRLRSALPGSTYRRLALWRYLVTWSKP